MMRQFEVEKQSDLRDCQLPALLGAGVGGQLPRLCLC